MPSLARASSHLDLVGEEEVDPVPTGEKGLLPAPEPTRRHGLTAERGADVV